MDGTLGIATGRHGRANALVDKLFYVITAGRATGTLSFFSRNVVDIVSGPTAEVELCRWNDVIMAYSYSGPPMPRSI
jgi:hypothetical protein